jgi:hypothetical protein
MEWMWGSKWFISLRKDEGEGPGLKPPLTVRQSVG